MISWTTSCTTLHGALSNNWCVTIIIRSLSLASKCFCWIWQKKMHIACQHIPCVQDWLWWCYEEACSFLHLLCWRLYRLERHCISQGCHSIKSRLELSASEFWVDGSLRLSRITCVYNNCKLLNSDEGHAESQYWDDCLDSTKSNHLRCGSSLDQTTGIRGLQACCTIHELKVQCECFLGPRWW